MQENCYIVASPDTHECIIIDPGDDATYISEKILGLQFTPVGIIATHGHFDHVMGALELQLVFSVPFMMHANDEFLLDRMNETAAHFLGHSVAEQRPQISRTIAEGMTVQVGSSSVQVLETPGHTPGSICLYSPTDAIVFVGDVLFKGGAIGRTDFSYGRPLTLRDSVDRLLKLPPDTLVYPGHGDTTTLGEEMVYHKDQSTL
jgi:glyoxylase-like metal-dependent hydrolase (beta-lactamase superfamily II)